MLEDEQVNYNPMDYLCTYGHVLTEHHPSTETCRVENCLCNAFFSFNQKKELEEKNIATE